jgi:hypothetical protein
MSIKWRDAFNIVVATPLGFMYPWATRGIQWLFIASGGRRSDLVRLSLTWKHRDV